MTKYVFPDDFRRVPVPGTTWVKWFAGNHPGHWVAVNGSVARYGYVGEDGRRRRDWVVERGPDFAQVLTRGRSKITDPEVQAALDKEHVGRMSRGREATKDPWDCLRG